MRSKEMLWGVVMDIYREMYRRSRPKADFDELVAKKVTMKSNWFMGYYLSVEQAELVINTVCKRHGLTAKERKLVGKEVLLGSSPNSSLEAWRDYRKSRGRR
jgi:hypothetical protein